ncbi:MAG: hypothetical protein Q7V58_05815 [Actinomycetota bacterium]|nr:hypothetical protein [Actinomycetota bacterium]
MRRLARTVSLSLLAGVLAVGAGTLTACGSAVENAVEEAAGNALGGDVSIDEGEIAVTDEEGNEMLMGEDVAVPDNWPSEVPIYDNGRLISVMVAGDGSNVNAVWQTDATTEEAAATYGAALESSGFTVGDTSAVSGMTNATYEGNGYTVTVTTLDAEGTATLMVNAEKA